jgi:MoaA/NifB/PqqE/SkfB family radical SAM enzyme
MTVTQSTFSRGDYGSPRLSIELTNICNLHCDYCLRDEDALYKTAAKHFPLDLLKRVLSEAKETMGVATLSFTGGEPSLHPAFEEILSVVKSAGTKLSFVTNGWNFEKLWPSVLNARDGITHVAFSLDGITAEEHDRWRGNGSFLRLIKAFSRCQRAKVPFVIKVGLRRDTASRLEAIAMFAARLGASALNFSHLLPTSGDVEDKSNLSLEERTLAEQEIAMLARVFKMNIGLDVGYYNTGSDAPCAPLAGTSANIDYRGRLTLCCNLSGFRGAEAEEEVAADLNNESFHTAYARLRDIAELQMERRRRALEQLHTAGQKADLFTGSPCLLCLQDFKKIPWRTAAARSENETTSKSPPLVQIRVANT